MSEENNIPKHWKILKLGELCDRMSNGANVQQIEEKIGFPISRIETIWNETIDLNRVKYIAENNKDFITKYALIEGDILFSHINSDLHLGKTAIYKNQTKVLIHGINLLLIRLKSDISSDFLNYQFKLKRSRGEFIRIAQKSVNQSSINQTKLKNLDFIIPPLPEQQAIVSKIEELLSDLENGKQQLQIAQQQLKIYRQSLLKMAFEGKLTNKNVKDGELPKGWKNVQIKDVAETFGGYAFKSGEFLSEGKYQVLRMGNVRPGIIRYSESPIFLNEVDVNVLIRSLLRIDDIIITQTGTRKKRDYGFTALIQKPNLLLNQRITSIRFIGTYLPKFFLYFSWTDFFKDQFFANETGNVGQGNVGMKAITETLIPYCNLHEQQLIVDELESKLTVCDKIEETISLSLLQAESLRQSILKKAFEGKLV